MHPQRELSLKNVQEIRALQGQLLVREVKQRFGIRVRRLCDQPVLVLLQHTEYAPTASEEASMDDNVAPDASAGDEEENEPQTFWARIEKAVSRASDSRAEDVSELVSLHHELAYSQRLCSYLKAELEETLHLAVEGTRHPCKVPQGMAPHPRRPSLSEQVKVNSTQTSAHIGTPYPR